MFTKPKNFNGSYFKYNKVPRKFKKKWRHILQGSRYSFLNLNQKLWFIQSKTNPEFNKFLIGKITNYEFKRN